MAKKKALQKNTQAIIVTTIAVLVSLAVLGWPVISYGMSLLSNNIATVNGEKLPKSHFKYYFYNQKMYYESFGGAEIWGYDLGSEQTPEQTAKSGALNTAISLMINKQEAKKRGLQLNEEELATLETNLADAKTSLGEEGIKLTGVSDNDLRNILSSQMLYDKLFEDVTKGFEMSTEAFEADFQQYWSENLMSLTNIEGDYIVTDTMEEAEAARSRVEQGEDFIEVLKATSKNYDPEQEYAAMPISETYGIPAEVVEIAFNTIPGTMTNVIETAESGYYIVRVNNVEKPDEAETKAQRQETYISEQKQAIFDAEYQIWESNAKISTNAELYTSINLASISSATVPAAEGSTDPGLEIESDVPGLEIESDTPGLEIEMGDQ